MLKRKDYIDTINEVKEDVLIYRLSTKKVSFDTFKVYFSCCSNIHLKPREHIGILYLMNYNFNDDEATNLYFKMLYNELIKK